MSEFFAGGTDEGISDQRHKGAGIGTIWMEPDDVTGDVTLSASFLALPGLTRADVLKDVIGVLEREYDEAVKQIGVRNAVSPSLGN